MTTLDVSRRAPEGAEEAKQKLRASDYSRFFEAGRDAAVIGDSDARVAHGLVPTTREERAAWDAGRASIGLNTLM